MKKILLSFFVLWMLGIISFFGINHYVVSFSDNEIRYGIEDIEETRVGLVFWARVYSNGIPSPILRDRLDTAIKAYEDKKIERIIVSGDNATQYYDEPTNMKAYLIDLWIPEEHIYIDYAGFDTFDSIYRSNYIFWVQDVVLFTQDYHLKRAVYIAERLWLNAQWMSTDLRDYRDIDYFERREMFSRIKAFLEIEILKSKPKFLGEQIEIL